MCYLRGEKLVAIQAGVAPRVVSTKHEKYTTPTPRCTLYAQRIVVLPNLAETNPIPYPTFLHVWIGQVPGYNNSSCPSGGKAVHMSEPSNELSAAFGLRPRVYVRVCVRRRDMLSLTAAVREFCRVYDTQRCRWCETLFMFCLGYF